MQRAADMESASREDILSEGILSITMGEVKNCWLLM